MEALELFGYTFLDCFMQRPKPPCDIGSVKRSFVISRRSQAFQDDGSLGHHGGRIASEQICVRPPAFSSLGPNRLNVKEDLLVDLVPEMRGLPQPRIIRILSSIDLCAETEPLGTAGPLPQTSKDQTSLHWLPQWLPEAPFAAYNIDCIIDTMTRTPSAITAE